MFRRTECCSRSAVGLSVFYKNCTTFFDPKVKLCILNRVRPLSRPAVWRSHKMYKYFCVQVCHAMWNSPLTRVMQLHAVHWRSTFFHDVNNVFLIGWVGSAITSMSNGSFFVHWCNRWVNLYLQWRKTNRLTHWLTVWLIGCGNNSLTVLSCNAIRVVDSLARLSHSLNNLLTQANWLSDLLIL